MKTPAPAVCRAFHGAAVLAGGPERSVGQHACSGAIVAPKCRGATGPGTAAGCGAGCALTPSPVYQRRRRPSTDFFQDLIYRMARNCGPSLLSFTMPVTITVTVLHT
jgi:hypothetical protein